MGAPIKYSRFKKTYYYTRPGNFAVGFRSDWLGEYSNI
jgi:hypothetical protein